MLFYMLEDCPPDSTCTYLSNPLATCNINIIRGIFLQLDDSLPIPVCSGLGTVSKKNEALRITEFENRIPMTYKILNLSEPNFLWLLLKSIERRKGQKHTLKRSTLVLIPNTPV